MSTQEKRRRWIYRRLSLLVREHTYRSRIVGYRGYLVAPFYGCVAFRCDDGTLQFDW